ncbi:hypothetical protein AVEN_73491-1 [Araneus ventricosus]|uniref:Uncharacterized protein n=1 Tax=Araneus ventricosus TaxID=182803 RepID=A0A4Y2L258_ARAVE|nr:hypothetical protein AVEN_73491-1 [Araneus ventricosus]
MSIDSGIVGGNEVNCHLSEKIGRDMISKMMGKNFEDVKFKRKGKVVTLASINSSVKIGSQYVVVDGGHLLHKIVWRKQATFGAIADRYVQYLNNKYGQDIAVIFYGYPDDDKNSTINCERLRRAAHSSPDVMFHEETVLQYTKEKLLANECNKKRFIELLKTASQKANICVQQAVEDANLTIVNTAISVAPQYDYVRVIGEDIDLLLLLTAIGIDTQ